MSDKQVKIKFLQDYTVQDEHKDDPEKRTSYKANAKKTMNAASAAHFIKRGIAEETR